jgi:hypothetical protein
MPGVLIPEPVPTPDPLIAGFTLLIDGGTFGAPFAGGVPDGATPVAEFTLGTNPLVAGAMPGDVAPFTEGMVLGTTPFAGGVLIEPVLLRLGVVPKVGLLGVAVVPRPLLPGMPLLFNVLLPLMAPLTPAPFGLGSPGCWTPSCDWHDIICAPTSFEQSVPGG